MEREEVGGGGGGREGEVCPVLLHAWIEATASFWNIPSVTWGPSHDTIVGDT